MIIRIIKIFKSMFKNIFNKKKQKIKIWKLMEYLKINFRK